ncbi:MAG: response regulator [Desulforegulaceae bacterium]|nr:response regulator [Desulforegulaceae bacterium]
MISTDLLLVDDEERFLQTTSKLIKKQKKDFKVMTAPGGKECLEIIRNNNIDVVILDVKMPGMDGVEVLREIKREKPLIEVIMLTGHSTTDSAIEGMKLGAYDYLLKPCDIEALIDKVLLADKRKKNAEERITQIKFQKTTSQKGF